MTPCQWRGETGVVPAQNAWGWEELQEARKELSLDF